MAVSIKQGDAGCKKIRLVQNGGPLNLEDVERIEFMYGGIRKFWPGEVEYDPETDFFLFPVEQTDTLVFPENKYIEADARVKYVGGDVLGVKKIKNITVRDAVSEEVI